MFILPSRTCVVALLLVGAIGFAQSDRGSITGTVTDPGSAVVPGIDGTIYDPLSNTTIDGLVYRTAFPGNTIPKNRMDPVALAVQNLIPKPNVNQNPVAHFQW